MKTKFNVLLTLLLAFVVQISFAQNKSVSGVVSDQSGAPLPGATVLVKGTNNGTTTDFDGNYNIQTTNGGVLVFSFIGYVTKEVNVGVSVNIDVTLEEDAQALEEVVVTGVAGSTNVKKLTVSVTRVSEEKLNIAPATSVGGALVGKVAGARVSMSSGRPGSGQQIQLRTDNNLGAGSSPLILMDGIIINTSLADINVDDIESMEVVRGAAASALYGSRAANGVIAIISKRGSKLSEGSSSVTIRNEVGFQQIQQYIDLAEHHYFKLSPNQPGNYTAYDGVTYPNGYTGGYSPLIKGSRLPEDDHYMDNPFTVNRDQQREYFRVGQTVTNFASYSSNSAKTNVYGSFENMTQSGVVPFTDGYKRQNFRFNVDHQVAPWLKLSLSNLYTANQTQFPGGAGSFFEVVLAEPDNDFKLDNPVDGQPYYPRHNHWSNETNPYYSAYKQDLIERKTSWISNFRANIKFNSWANLTLTHSIENQNWNYTAYSPFDTWTIGSGGDNDYGLVYNKGSLTKTNTQSRQNNTQVTLNLKKQFNDLIVTSQLSFLNEDNQYEYFGAGSNQFAIRNLPTLNAFTEIKSYSSTNTSEIARNYFGILGLDYKDRYLIDIMARRDGSSLFGEEARWANYFRLSGAYRVTQDIDIPGVQELKIRAATGTAGIRPGFNWQYETYSLSQGVTSPSQKGNSLLRPSQTRETEFGLDVSFLNRFTFQATYAKSETSDQFINAPLIPFVSDGFVSQYQNAGTVSANTLELSLGANIVSNKDFSWDTNVVFGQSQQTITELPIAPYQSGPDGLYFIKEGETYGSIYGYTWVNTLDEMANQLPSGKAISDYEVNSDGFVVPAGSQGTTGELPIRLKDENGSDAFVKIGDGLPDFTMGISNTIKYKGAFLYFLFDVKGGGDVYNRKSQWLTRDTRNGIMDMSNVPADQKKTFDYFLQLYDVNSNNSYWVEDASFVKLRELSIGYKFEKEQLAKFGNVFKSITARVIGRNLLTFTEYSGYDPEVGSIRNPFDGTSAYPNFRNVAFSLSLDF